MKKLADDQWWSSIPKDSSPFAVHHEIALLMDVSIMCNICTYSVLTWYGSIYTSYFFYASLSPQFSYMDLLRHFIIKAHRME